MRPTYVTPTSESTERLIGDIFAVGAIGYVALDRNGDIVMRAKVTAGTSVETNFYEEYFVNPMATSRKYWCRRSPAISLSASRNRPTSRRWSPVCARLPRRMKISERSAHNRQEPA